MSISAKAVETKKGALLFIVAHEEVFNLRPTPEAVKSISGKDLAKLHKIFFDDDVKICANKTATIKRLTQYMLFEHSSLAFDSKTFVDM